MPRSTRCLGGFASSKSNYSVVPWATYTDPEVARVGLSEDEAAAKGHRVRSYATRTRARGSRHHRRRNAWLHQGVDASRGSDRVLGATIVAPQAGELIAEYVLAMTHGLGLKKLMGTIHVYPTRAEINKFAASTWRRKHAPSGLLKFAQMYHAWWR